MSRLVLLAVVLSACGTTTEKPPLKHAACIRAIEESIRQAEEYGAVASQAVVALIEHQRDRQDVRKLEMARHLHHEEVVAQRKLDHLMSVQREVCKE